MKPQIGDLFDQPVECIVNSWNRNIVPTGLLVPHGVSGAMKKRTGQATFKELRSKGPLKLGAAVATSAGMLGSGSGRFPPERAESLMLETFAELDYPIEVTLVRYDGTNH